jgi:hypothetical protein
MDLKKIRALLAEYYEGRTSIKEEISLTDFFSGPDVPSDLEADRLLFLSLSESAKEIITDEHFDEKLFAAIERQDNEARKRVTRKLLIGLSGIAAGVIILMGSYLLLRENQAEESFLVSEERIIHDPETAYQEARNALILISQVMNKGTGELGSLSKLTDATRELQMISRFDEAVSAVSQKDP